MNIYIPAIGKIVCLATFIEDNKAKLYDLFEEDVKMSRFGDSLFFYTEKIGLLEVVKLGESDDCK